MDAKICVVDCLSFNEWRLGIFSRCMLKLGEAVGAIDWIGLRYSFSLQRLRHHLIAE